MCILSWLPVYWLSVCLSVYLSIYLSSVYLSIYLSIFCLSSIIYLSNLIYHLLSMYVSIYHLLSITYLSVFLSPIFLLSIICLSIYLSSINLSSIHPLSIKSIYLPIHPSIHPSTAYIECYKTTFIKYLLKILLTSSSRFMSWAAAACQQTERSSEEPDRMKDFYGRREQE